MNRILRITIGIGMLFCLYQCSKEETLKTLSEKDTKQLAVIGNIINEDVDKSDK